MNSKTLFPILILLLCGLYLGAQRLPTKFQHLTTDQGLSTGTAYFTFRDSRGFIWIGTVDGLNRYDGYSITIFKNNPTDSTSLSDNNIQCMAEDASGRLWVGTRNNGISIFDYNTETFSHYPIGENGLDQGQIRDIEFLPNGDALIASHGSGLMIYDATNEQFTSLRNDPSNPNSIVNDNVFSITPDEREGFYWIGAHSGTLELFDLKSRSFTHYIYDPNFNQSQTNRKPIFIDSKKRIWIGTDGFGLHQFNRQTQQFRSFDYTSGRRLTSGIITTFYEDSYGRILIGTDGYGINVYDPQVDRFTYIRNSDLDPSSISSDAIYDIYKDPSGVIWISTFRGGVNIYSPKKSKFEHYKKEPGNPNSLAFNSVISILEDSKGTIWVGTDGGGLDEFDPETQRFTHHVHSPRDPSSISSNVAIALMEDHNGYLWVGTYAAGLNQYNPATGRFRRFLPDPTNPGSLASRNVWSILEDRQQRVWLGTLDGGLDLYDPITNSFTHFKNDPKNPQSISSNLIITMLEDSYGNFWIGTEDKGLNLFDREAGKFRNWTHDSDDANSLANNNVKSLLEFDGQLWIGTADGISIMDLKTMTLAESTINELLPNLVVNGIEADQYGDLWIATNYGISKYDPRSKTIQHFTKEDGLQGTEFNYTASTLSNYTGKLYFGGINGFNEFDPKEITISKFDPPVEITEIRLFDKALTTQTILDGKQILTESLLEVQNITLKHNQNVISFEFASLDYNSPSSNKYKYQLVNFDENWIETTSSKRTATYTNLDPGKYEFVVMGTNSDGRWSTHVRKIELIVLAPWWATLWFRLIALTLILGGTISAIRWRINMIKAQRNALEEKVETATSQILIQNEHLQEQQENLRNAIAETKEVVKEAVESGSFSARIKLDGKTGEWRELGELINSLFDSIIFPISSIIRVIDAMSQSDLSLRYEGDAKGDIKTITDNLNSALQNVSDLLESINEEAGTIGESSQEMQHSSEEMNINTGEIAASIAEMARGAHSQVQQIDESSSLLEGILKFSNEMGDQANSINEAAKNGVSQSAEGKELISEVDSTMKSILNNSDATTKSIEILDARAGEISQVLRMIKEISAQTNLLALNAGIEAAKAGESGRGFSVIAHQIRQLALDSSNSAKVIEGMILEVQQATKETSQLVTEMSTNIRGGEKASERASASFEQIAASYSQTFLMSQQILEATRQQNEDVSKVVSIMEGVVVIAEQTAAGTEEIASSAAELSSGMSTYNEKAKTVSSIVENLINSMKQFILRR